MRANTKAIITYSTLLLVLLFFFFWGLAKAKGFLAPISVAALLAMVVLPVSHWLEGKGIKRGWAALLCDLLILLFFAGLAWVLAAQVKNLAQDWPQIKERMVPKINQLQEFIADKTGISVQEQDQKVSEKVPGDLGESGRQDSGNSGKEGSNNQPAARDSIGQQEGQEKQGNQQQGSSPQNQEKGPLGSKQNQEQTKGQSSSGGGSMMSTAGDFLMQFFSFLGTFLLTFVYIFFFLLYRKKFKKSILKMAPEEKRERTKDILSHSVKISQSYLSGRLILILFLAILYAIGLSISGVKHAILISVLAAVLSLIPYIGNIVGFFLAIAMAFFSGSGFMGALGVAITFAIAQFVESYILEPYIVGDKVELNPVVTILVVVLGEAVWGVIGMLIAIPALGIAKVIFDHIPVLKPLAYLFGQEDIGDEESKDNFFTRTKQWALNKFK